jgi:hypothetical protein
MQWMLFSETYEGVHGMCGTANDHPEDDEARSHEGNVSSAHQVGDGTDEGTDGGQGEEVGQNEPNPAVRASKVAINVWRYATEQVHWNLAAGPQECHGDQAHDSSEGHLWFMVMVLSISIGPDSILLIVVGVPRHSRDGADDLDLLRIGLGLLRRGLRAVWYVST